MLRQINVAFFIGLMVCFMSTAFTDISLENRWSYYHQFCPYSNFCTQNATKIKTSDEANLTSCCLECSCDSDCQKFGICCPDFTRFTDTNVLYPCVDLLQYFNLPRGLCCNQKSKTGFHIIDDCPSLSNKSHHYNSCVAPVKLEDFIVVNDKTNGRIYKNKHCAYCHGVRDHESWNITTDCKDVIEIQFETFEQRNSYLVDNCRLIPIPPETQMISKYRCMLTKYTFDTPCFTDYNNITNNIAERENIDNIKMACEMDNPYVKGVFYSVKWYPNIFCYICENGYNAPSSELCDIFFTPGKDIYKTFTTLISYKTKEASVQADLCDISSIWDTYSKSCLKLFCPLGSIPEFGICQSVTVSSSSVVTAAYSSVLESDVELSNTIITVFDSIITAKLGKIKPCGRCSLVMLINNPEIILFYRLFTHSDCNLDYLLSKMEKALEYSMALRFQYMNKTIIAEPAITTLTNYRWFIPRSVIEYESDCDQTEISVFNRCARIDTRMIPSFADNKSLLMFDGNVIDNKVCVHDYFKLIESLSNVALSSIHTPLQLAYCLIWFLIKLLSEVVLGTLV